MQVYWEICPQKSMNRTGEGMIRVCYGYEASSVKRSVNKTFNSASFLN